MNKIVYITLLLITFVVISCERDEEKILLDSSIIGEWQVITYLDGDPVSTTFPLSIYYDNTSGPDSITLRDSAKYFWNFQVKASANHEDGTFETKKSICTLCNYGIGVKIFNGKIINSDSIYFEIQFEDDEIPYGNTFQLKGHRTK